MISEALKSGCFTILIRVSDVIDILYKKLHGRIKDTKTKCE